jgi:hypothetical protein
MRSKAINLIGWVSLALISLALVVTVIAAFATLPRYVLEHSAPIGSLSPVQLATAESSIRGSLLQAVGGILLVAGAITAWRQMLIGRRQHILDRHVAVTEAFAKAVEYLGNVDTIDVRLGGIYSLDRVSDDDPAEMSRVAEILCAFVRERSPSDGDLPRDVLAALIVLARRPWPISIDLANTNLMGAQLRNAQLSNAILSAANLSDAVLSGAILRNATLTGADLRRADLTSADLRGAFLAEIRLSGALANSATRWPTGFVSSDHGVLTN